MESEDFDSNITIKFETDGDDEMVQANFNSKKSKYNWTQDATLKLIEAYEKDCRELWDSKLPAYKDRTTRQQKLEYLAQIFLTTSDEITRKVHNLRTQFCCELRKIKKKRRLGGEEGSSNGSSGGGAGGGSGWEYFEALSFLAPQQNLEAETAFDGVNMALAEFQANEEMEFGAAAQAYAAAAASAAGADNANSSSNQPSSTSSPRNKPRSKMRVAASCPPPLPPNAHPMLWSEETPMIRPGMNADDCQIFGDFVASELRMLRHDESRKRLKRQIQKAILQVGEDEDMEMLGG